MKFGYYFIITSLVTGSYMPSQPSLVDGVHSENQFLVC